nr:unnamed protein product [Digitaria exilis]
MDLRWKKREKLAPVICRERRSERADEGEAGAGDCGPRNHGRACSVVKPAAAPGAGRKSREGSRHGGRRWRLGAWAKDWRGGAGWRGFTKGAAKDPSGGSCGGA